MRWLHAGAMALLVAMVGAHVARGGGAGGGASPEVDDDRHRQLLGNHKAFLLAACPPAGGPAAADAGRQKQCGELATAVERAGKIAARLSVGGAVGCFWFDAASPASQGLASSFGWDASPAGAAARCSADRSQCSTGAEATAGATPPLP